MRLEAIRTFVAVVQSGSYAAAGEALFISPTTAHGHVRSMEEELGATLVSFTNRKLELTRAGSRFFMFAERVLDEFAQAEHEISGLVRQSQDHLRIASLNGPAVHLVPPVVSAFHAVRPEALVTVNTRGVGECLAALVSGQADLAILNELHREDATGILSSSVLYEDMLTLVVRADCYAPPDVALLGRYPLAVQPSSSAYRQYLQRWARQEGIAISPTYEHTSFDGILAHVMNGGCVGMMAGYIPRLSPLAGRLRVLELPRFSLPRQVIAVHSARPDPLSREFIAFFQEFYGVRPELRGSGFSE